MRQHFGPPLGIGSTRPVEGDEGEPFVGECSDAGSSERPVAQQVDDCAGALERQGFKIDSASRIAKGGVATRLKRPSDRLAQHIRQ